MKKCSACKNLLPYESFYTDKTKRDGIGSKCKECAMKSSRDYKPTDRKHFLAIRKEWRDRNKEKLLDYQRKYRAKYADKLRVYQKLYKRTKQDAYRFQRYGIDPIEYDKLKERQNNACGMCERKFEGKLSPQIDHDHKTGEVRGLLCNNCNIRLGYFESEIFKAQVEKYLRCKYIEVTDKE